jgi:glycosyltransferase involved in cell wall biosynthesis
VTNSSMFAKELALSVVMPCYRCKDTIQRAIDSLADQTAIPKEVILVDDFSNDGTLEYLQQLSSQYKNGWIKVLALPRNSGPGVARNEGWKIATEPYIAFLDADDSWHAQKAYIQHEWMRTHPGIFLSGHLSIRYSQESATKLIANEFFVQIISPSRLLFSNVFSTRSIMCRSDLPIFFDNEKRYVEDYWWLMKVAYSGYSIAKLSVPMAFTYKQDYGESGLSSKLWAMEKDELDNYWRLVDAGWVARPIVVMLSFYSILKYLKRVIVSELRRFVTRVI